MVTRTQTFDLLKGIAVLLMVQVHIVELIASPGLFNSSIGKIFIFLGGPPVAPVFALILGYFLAASKRTAKQLIVRGFKIFSLGMILNVLLNLNLIISVNKGLFKIDLLPYFFGVDILHFAGIAIIVITALKKQIEKSLTLLFVLCCVAAYLGSFLINYIPENVILKYCSAFFYGSCHWSYFPFFPWIAYPLIGFAFYKIKQNNNLNMLNTKNGKIAISFLFSVFIIFSIQYAVSVSSDLQTYYHHGVLFFSWLILFLAFYGFFINEFDKLIGNIFFLKYIKWLGKNVTLIYVIQWIIIGNIATEIYKTISSPLYLLVIFLAVLILASGIGYLVLEIKNRFSLKPKPN